VCGSARQKKIQEQIEVITADRQIKWQEESGGGKTIIALGLRLGIFKLLKEYKQVRGDFLIVDEAFSFLDTTNSELVLNMLVDSFSELGLKQMFIVSHNELKDMLPVTLWINYDQEKQKAFIEQA
jgi:DNA repair exonuclease SbcCD ATPase subunit